MDRGEDAPRPAAQILRRLNLFILPLLAIAPLLYGASILIQIPIELDPAPLPDQVIDGDGALCELALRSVDPGALDSPMVGAYSRLGFHHPGPLHYLLMAPVYALGGSTLLSMTLAAGLLQAVLFGLSIAVVQRAFGQRAGFLLALVTIVHVWLHTTQLFSVWEPAIARTALWATVAGSLAAASGRASGLWLAALAGSLALQSHLGVAVPVLLCWSGSALILRHGGMAQQVRPVLGASALIVLLWLPPLLEQTGLVPRADVGLEGAPQGNLSRTLEVMTAERETIPTVEALRHAMTATTAETGQVFGLAVGEGSIFVLALHVLGLGLLFWRAIARRSPVLLGLGATSLLLHLATLTSALRIVGEVPGHLLAFGALAAFPLWIGLLGAALSIRLPNGTKWARTAVLVVLAAGAAWLGHRSSQTIGGNLLAATLTPGAAATPGLGSTLPILFTNLEAEGIESIEIEATRPEDRLIEAGIVNGWDRLGRPVRPDQRSVWLYPGTRFRTRLADPDARIVLGPKRDGALPLTATCYVTVESD